MKTILSVLVCLLSLTVVAQQGSKSASPKTSAAKASPQKEASKKEPGCYDQWYALFKERGAKPLADGTHDVIISIRNEYDYAECFLGKIDLKDGKLASKLQIQKVDGTYEEFDKKISASYQNSEGVVKEELRNVSSGMSEAFSLTDGEKIRLFFYKSLADKAKANQKAPSVSELVKN